MKVKSMEIDEEGKNIFLTFEAKNGPDLVVTRETFLALEGSPFLVRAEGPTYGGKRHLDEEGLIGYDEISLKIPIGAVSTFNNSFVS